MLLLKGLALWALIALLETVHGILRARLLAPRVGDLRSRQLGVFSGSALILAAAWFSAPWLGASGPGQALAVGALWTALMLAYEWFLVRRVFRLPLSRLLDDLNPSRGGLLWLGMIVLWLAPLAAFSARH